MAEKQVSTIFYFIRVSQSKNWVPFRSDFLRTSSSVYPASWIQDFKMAVTPTEVLLLEMRMARVVYMRDVSNRMSQVYVEVLSSQLQHQTTNEETSVNTSAPSVGGGGFNRLCG